jgi:hypothetical protein
LLRRFAPRNDDETGEPKNGKANSRRAATAAGQCLCGKVAFEIDVPARWAWHDHSPRAAARMARPMRPMSEAGASAFASPRARPPHALRGQGDKTARSFCASCGTPIVYERARSPHMVNIHARCSRAAPAVKPLYHIAIEELQEWAYTGEPLVPLKGFPGVVWQRSKKKKRAELEGMF